MEEVVRGFILEATPSSYWVRTHSRVYVILVRRLSPKSIVSMLLEAEGGQNMLRSPDAGLKTPIQMESDPGVAEGFRLLNVTRRLSTNRLTRLIEVDLLRITQRLSK